MYISPTVSRLAVQCPFKDFRNAADGHWRAHAGWITARTQARPLHAPPSKYQSTLKAGLRA
jgi:hypothetical protein